MVPKNETSPNADDQMQNPEAEKSYSSASLDIGELTLSLQSKLPRRTSLHQRSASDCIAFVKKPYWVGPSSKIGAGGCLELDGGDADGKAIDYYMETKGDSSSASSLGTETHEPTKPGKWSRNFGPEMDPKKMKRLIANRVSAQKSRLRKAEYIEKLRREINIQEAKVALLAPQVSFYEMQRMMLQKENNAMKQRMEVLEKEKAMKDAEYQALKDERDMLAFTYFLMQEGI